MLMKIMATVEKCFWREQIRTYRSEKVSNFLHESESYGISLETIKRSSVALTCSVVKALAELILHHSMQNYPMKYTEELKDIRKKIRNLSKNEKSFCLEETECTIKRLSKGTTPRPNNSLLTLYSLLPSFYFKSFKLILQTRILTKAGKKANHALFNKEDKFKVSPSTYRHILLLNIWGKL